MAKPNEVAQLNEKQKRFCEEYVIDFNGTQAAIRAKYSSKTARSQAQRMLTNVDIQQYVKSLIAKLANKSEITAERVLLEYKRIAFGSVVSFFDVNGNLRPLNDLSEDEKATLSSLEVYEEYLNIDGTKVAVGQTKKIKVWDKLSALDSLSKYLGLFEKDNEQKKPILPIVIVKDSETAKALDKI